MASAPGGFLDELCGNAGTGVTDAPGTSGSQTTTDSSRSGQSAQSDNDNGTDFPGSYTVPEGWAKMERYSTENKIFYAEEGHEDDEMPDNISVEVGTNRYSADEHEKFREAILRQLAMQLQGVDAELTGDGTFTEQDYSSTFLPSARKMWSQSSIISWATSGIAWFI